MTPNRTVLLIDDDSAISQVLCEILEDAGFAVTLAADGEEGLRKLTSETSLILLDLRMPGVNGWEFCERRRSLGELSQVPVVILSADARARRAAMELGAVACLGKPVELDHLLQTVHRWARSAGDVARRLG